MPFNLHDQVKVKGETLIHDLMCSFESKKDDIIYHFAISTEWLDDLSVMVFTDESDHVERVSVDGTIQLVREVQEVETDTEIQNVHVILPISRISDKWPQVAEMLIEAANQTYEGLGDEIMVELLEL